MRFVPLDTTPEAYRVQLEVLRRMTPEQCLEQAMRLSETVIRLCESGIRAHHPEYGDREIFLARARAVLGDPLFREAYPDAPRLDP